MKTESPWSGLGRVKAAGLLDPRLQLHHAVQLLASFGQALARPEPDDSHRAMSWDPAGQAFRSASAADAPDTFISLRPASLELRVQRGAEAETLHLTGTTLDEAYRWLEADLGRALAPPEYEIPEHPVGSGAVFSAQPHDLEELSRWYGAAHQALEAVRHRHAGAGSILCWPHHFDMAVLLTLPGTDDEGRTRTVGVGVSPGDATYPSPYGYVTPWPYPWEADRRGVPPGHWHTEGWLGAVLPAEAWVEAQGGAERVRRVTGWYQDAVAAALVMHQD